MQHPTSQNFDRLISILKQWGDRATKQSSDTPEYAQFINTFPIERLPELTMEEYCLGRAINDNFSWWMEIGLRPALGRWFPGSARAHIMYFQGGHLYKHRRLKNLTDEEALRYTLRIQATIAAADPQTDISWVDDDQQIFARSGLSPRVTVSKGRKLRLIAAYHPEGIVPIYSTDHIGHYLQALGCSATDIPSRNLPIARSQLLWRYFEQARQSVPGLSPLGFMSGLYSEELGIAPTKDTEIDDSEGPAYLLTWNPEHFDIGGNDGVRVGEEASWTSLSTKPKLGDSVYLIRLGIEPRGIVAQGVVTESSYEDTDWRDANKKRKYIKFKALDVRPDCESGLLPMQLLVQSEPNFKWSPQASGIAIPEAIAEQLGDLWESGKGKHSLKQYVEATNENPKLRRDDWLAPYLETTQLAKAIANDPSKLTDEALQELWGKKCNGVTDTGPGTLPGKEFTNGRTLLIQLTQSIFAKPDAGTMTDVEHQWKQAVEQNIFAKNRYAVIRRVFAAIKPELYTTILNDKHCEQLLKILSEQFQLKRPNPSGDDWIALNTDIKWALNQAGLGDTDPIQANTAMWQLLAPALKSVPDQIPVDTDDPDALKQVHFELEEPTNLILYGPPGTGKTFNTVNEAIRILEPALLNMQADRQQLKAAFDRYVAAGQIVVTTFHQSYSYEDFVEGIRAETDERGQIRYILRDGVFKSLCNPQPTFTFSPGAQFGANNGYRVKRANADIVVLRKPNGNELPLPMSIIRELGKLVEEKTISTADIRDAKVFDKVSESHLEKYIVNGYNNILAPLVEAFCTAQAARPEATTANATKVLIIDEINRGNISRIFGELITLIETTKRQGMLEALEVTLPYSKERFIVPANLHIIGTMNTADRSLAGLDIALRRRFSFQEMEPQPEELSDVNVLVDDVSVNIGAMLQAMNERIEALLDRDHRLGHAFFMSLTNNPTLLELARIFREHIMPLLEEYFFEDWQRIQWVLNDHRKANSDRFIRAPENTVGDLFGASVSVDEQRLPWVRNPSAFDQIKAYSGIIKVEMDTPA